MTQRTRAACGAAMRFALHAATSSTDECVLWPYARSDTGYGRISINGRAAYVHRFVLERVAGPAPKGMVAAHAPLICHHFGVWGVKPRPSGRGGIAPLAPQGARINRSGRACVNTPAVVNQALDKVDVDEATRYAGYRYELRPTPEQVDALWRTFSHCRLAYNFAVGRRHDLWKHEQCKISAAELDAEWTDVKSRKDWLYDTSSVPQQQAIRDAHQAFVNWWDRRAKAPKFKGKKNRRRWSSARWTRSAFRLRDTDKGQVLYLAGVGELKVLWSRDLPSGPTSVAVRCTPTGRWFVSFRVEVQPTALPATDSTVGIDIGIGDRLWTTSDGEVVENPRRYRRTEKRLKRTSRHASRKQVGSRRWKRTQRRVAKLHQRTAAQRKDYQHKETTALVRRANVATQADRPKAWMRSTKLGKSTADAAPGRTFTLIDYKADWYGRARGRVGTFERTTGVCPEDWAKTKLGLGDRVWVCPICGVEHDRDHASARVIAVLAQWDAGRDTKDAASVSGLEDRPPSTGPSQGRAA